MLSRRDAVQLAGIRLLRRLTLGLRQVPGGVIAGDLVRKMMGQRHRVVDVGDFDGDLRLSLDLGEHMQSQIFWHGSYSRNIIFLLKRLLKPGFNVIDAGANIGELSLIAAKAVAPGGKVFAFEPVERFADRLEAHIAANRLTNLHLVREGLSDEAGNAEIYLPPERFRDGTKHDGLGTLFRTDVRSAVEATVPITTLDLFVHEQGLAKLDVVKLDVEGSELPALKGAVSVLRDHRPALIIEVAEITCRAAGYEVDELIGFVRQFGYAVYTIGRRGRLSPLEKVGLTPFQNVLCVHESRRDSLDL
jgi:FkbM family methyltransferase